MKHTLVQSRKCFVVVFLSVIAQQWCCSSFVLMFGVDAHICLYHKYVVKSFSKSNFKH